MKRVYVIALVSALLFAMVAIGGTQAARNCPPGCVEVCSPAACATTCGSAATCGSTACTWDHSRWSGLIYTAGGSLVGEVTAEQARQVVNQYLIRRGAKEVCINKIDDTASSWVVLAHAPDGQHRLAVAKKTAWVRLES